MAAGIGSLSRKTIDRTADFADAADGHKRKRRFPSDPRYPCDPRFPSPLNPVLLPGPRLLSAFRLGGLATLRETARRSTLSCRYAPLRERVEGDSQARWAIACRQVAKPPSRKEDRRHPDMQQLRCAHQRQNLPWEMASVMHATSITHTMKIKAMNVAGTVASRATSRLRRGRVCRLRSARRRGQRTTS